MKAAERDSRQQRWTVWHTAALPLMKRFPSAASFIDPHVIPNDPAAATFLALRGVGGDAPDWVWERFGLSPPGKG